MGRLTGKVALITGAAQGMGAEHARTFIKEGAKVIMTDVKEADGERLAAELGADAVFIKHDVANGSDWQNVSDYTERMQSIIQETVALLGDAASKTSYELTSDEMAVAMFQPPEKQLHRLAQWTVPDQQKPNALIRGHQLWQRGKTRLNALGRN